MPGRGEEAPASPPPAAGERVARPPIPDRTARDGARHSSRMTRISSSLVNGRVLSGPARSRGTTLEYRGPGRPIKGDSAAYISETPRGERAGAAARRRVTAVHRGARVMAVALVLVLQGADAAALEISGDHRLLRRFIEDGAIVQKAWYEAAASYEDSERGHDLEGTIAAAFRVGRDLETGIVAGVLARRREAGERLFGAGLASSVDTAGLADGTLYAKYRILRSPIELAIGGAALLPLADSSHELGPGALGFQGFLGLRRSFAGATLVGSLGATDRSDSRAEGGARGRSAGRVGTGILVPLSYVWTFVGEVTYDGPRYEGDRADSRVLAGLDWRPTANLVVRGGVGGGLSERAPGRSATISAAFHF